MFLQEAADRPGQSAHESEYDSKSDNKADTPGECLFRAALPTASEVGDVDGEHGQQAGRNEGDDPLKE